ncbi:hypothetical protein, partial [Paenibacillus marchantiophytorum]|uniref:hypothetical protein n=1 Tax=Paenibacillus marchantiophytorum TaxID=1619310 RepID=UPI001E58A56A
FERITAPKGSFRAQKSHSRIYDSLFRPTSAPMGVVPERQYAISVRKTRDSGAKQGNKGTTFRERAESFKSQPNSESTIRGGKT